MKKWKCADDICANKCEVSEELGLTPKVCPYTGAVKKFEPVTDCDQLPTLTAEVFDRPDCPEWAKCAAVDGNGIAFWYGQEPEKHSCEFRIIGWGHERMKKIPGKFDASGWQDSLIKRPKKKTLPDWCKVGEWCYCKDDDGNDKYFKITGCDKHFIYGDDGWDIAVPCAKPARLRPYNAEEMRGLVGKVIENKNYTYFINAFDKGLQEVVSGSDGYSAKALVEFGYTIDGSPCGVLEHFDPECEEWVK